MKIVMFTGFLGSGKTTLALDFARHLSEEGKKTAFIINEAGEIALDSQLAREKNYRVEEVFAGCICCQVSDNKYYVFKKPANWPASLTGTLPRGA
jgi:G3E family GTPase